MLSLKTLLYCKWYFQPPASGFFALPKGEVVFVVAEINNILMEIILICYGVVVFAIVIPINKIPYHLCNELGSRLLSVIGGLVIVDAQRAYLVAHTGIPHQLTHVFRCDAIGRAIDGAGGITVFDSGNINANNVRIAQLRFYNSEIFFQFTQPAGVEIQVVDGFEKLVIDVVPLAGNG